METTTQYLQVLEDLRRRKRWGTDVNTLRFVALTLASTGRSDLTHRLEDTAAELYKLAGWTSPLRSSIRYVIAAMILKHDLAVRQIHRGIETVREEFRRRKMRRGGTHEVLAALLLVLKGKGRAVPASRIDRLQQILADWKRDHRWLTGSDDYPMAALHATREESVEQVALRIEQIYQALRAARYSRGNQMQLASHLLAIGSSSPRQAAARFDALVKAFKNRKWRIHSSRYDEVAVLTLCSSGPVQLAQKVLRIQARLHGVKPRPTRDVAFSIAAGVALSEEAQKLQGMAETQDIAAARMALAAIEAQQAAMVACMAGATVATTAATSGS